MRLRSGCVRLGDRNCNAICTARNLFTDQNNGSVRSLHAENIFPCNTDNLHIAEFKTSQANFGGNILITSATYICTNINNECGERAWIFEQRYNSLNGHQMSRTTCDSNSSDNNRRCFIQPASVTAWKINYLYLICCSALAARVSSRQIIQSRSIKLMPITISATVRRRNAAGRQLSISWINHFAPLAHNIEPKYLTGHGRFIAVKTNN